MLFDCNLFECFCWLTVYRLCFSFCWIFDRIRSGLQKSKLLNRFVSEPVRRPDAIEFPTHALQNFLPQTVTVTRIFG